jgi:outer membrane lipoprotein-sorting protein
MTRQLRKLFVCLALVAGVIRAAGDSVLDQVLARMDRAAKDFKSMTAEVTWVSHTEVLNENDQETGTITLKKVHAGEVDCLVDFTAPDRKTIELQKHAAREYLPKLKTVQVFDLKNHAEQIEQFMMIGFGTSGSELAKDYDMTVLGTEPWQGQQTVHLQLIPKSADAKPYVQKVEIWIPAQGNPYPLHEKIFEPSGDYRLVTFSDLKINPPLPADALKLKLPSGVQTVYPGK